MTTKAVEAAATMVVVRPNAEGVTGAVVIAEAVIAGVVTEVVVIEVVETGAVHLYALSAAVAADLNPFDRPIVIEATEVRMQIGPQRATEVFAART
jgi:hypothetical protein